MCSLFWLILKMSRYSTEDLIVTCFGSSVCFWVGVWYSCNTPATSESLSSISSSPTVESESPRIILHFPFRFTRSSFTAPFTWGGLKRCLWAAPSYWRRSWGRRTSSPTEETCPCGQITAIWGASAMGPLQSWVPHTFILFLLYFLSATYTNKKLYN